MVTKGDSSVVTIFAWSWFSPICPAPCGDCGLVELDELLGAVGESRRDWLDLILEVKGMRMELAALMDPEKIG